MALIPWTEKLNLDIEDIDQQHMKFLEIINDLLLAMNEKRAKEILGEIINRLVEYAIYHFSTEERYFHKYDYPDMYAHQKQHETFIDKVTEFKDAYENHKITLSIEMIYYFNNWWVTHILHSDMKYQSFLHQYDLS